MKVTTLLRLLSRIGVAAVVVFFVALVGVQYARVIGRNIALAHEVRRIEGDVAALKTKRAHQLREIRRLSDPHGAIPEIHDRLRLVGEREAIIYLKQHGTPP